MISDSGRQLLQKGEHVSHNIMFVIMSCMTQACWCGQALCTMTEHYFTSLSEVTLHWNGIAERLIWIIFAFFRNAVRSDFLFMAGNALQHRSAHVSNVPECKDIKCRQWLLYFLDLNPSLHA